MSQGPGPTTAPTEKAKNFTGTWKRLLGELRPERWRIAAVVVLTIVAVVLNVVAPRVLARATNIIFEGVLGTLLSTRGLPDGLAGDQLAQVLRDGGQDGYADMLSAYDVVVGRSH